MGSLTQIALLRRTDGLFHLLVERSEGESGPIYSELLRPLQHATSNQGERELLDAWQLLGAVREIRAPVLEAVRYVLSVTVIDPEGERPTLARLELAPPPAPRAATAAHPRAYQGTKDRPPKPRRPMPRDLRPFLCVPGGQDRLVQLLTAELGEITLPDEERSAPPGFRRGLAWTVKLLHQERLADAIAAHHELDLERDLELRRATAVFVQTLIGTYLYAWLRVAARIPGQLRIRFVELVAKTGASHCDPANSAEDLAEVAAGCSDKNFETRMRYALTIVANGDATSDLAPSLQWADLHAPTFLFPGTHSGDYQPPPQREAMEKLGTFLEAYFPSEDWGAMHVWEACCFDPALPDELDRIAAARLDPKGARLLGRTLANAVLYDDCSLDSWRSRSRELRTFVAALGRVDFQAKAAHLLSEIVWQDSLDHLELTSHLVPLACSKPLAEESDIETPLERFGLATPSSQGRLLAAPRRSYQVLDEESERTNAAWLIRCGFDSLIRHAEELFVTAFVDHPRTLCRASRTLGLLAAPQRHAIVQQALAGPLARDRTSMDPAGIVAHFDRHAPKVTKSPVPKKLRQHLSGAIQLTDAQLARATELVRKAWPAVQCDDLQERTLTHLARNLGTDQVDLTELNEQMVHALKLQAGSSSNRRGIRKLLRACYRGDASYLHRHARNQAWLKQHANLAERWLQGIELTRELEGYGPVTLTIERNPLEALRLGTYVGSCLGLGGSFAWSAAAIVLDINKHVVFARDKNQRFLARQVLACNSAGKIACYEVYPASSSGLKQLFREFDQQFATHLGVPLASDSDEDHEIELLVAREWWDDGIWSDDS